MLIGSNLMSCHYGCVNAERFNHHFTKWVKNLLPTTLAGKTVDIDGKTICSTDKLTNDGSVLHIELLTHARMEWGVEAMHWLLDVHFSEDKTRVWDMNLQKNLNIMRKTVLNLVEIYKTKTCPKSSIVGVLRRNLFDLRVLSDFLAFFINGVN